MRGGGGGLVETNGKWHVAGPREGETREEVDNLDPGMNDPLPLGTRGIPLSRRPSPPSTSLARPFHPLFEPTRRRLRRDPFLSLPFHPFPLPLRSPPTRTSVPRPLTIIIPLLFSFSFFSSSSARSSALSLSDSRRHSPFLPRFHSRRTLALHANLSRGG